MMKKLFADALASASAVALAACGSSVRGASTGTVNL
jgi:hypothetical protein